MLEVVRQSRAREVAQDRSRIGLSFEALEPLLALADAVAIVVASLVGGAVFHQVAYGTPGDLKIFLGLGLIASIGYAFIAHYLEFYALRKFLEARKDYLQVIGAWACVVLMVMLLLFLLKLGDQVSRGSVMSMSLLSAVALVAGRKRAKTLCERAIASGALRGKRVILIGTYDEVSAINQDYLFHKFGVEEVDHVFLPQHGPAEIAANQRLRVDELMDRVRSERVEELMLAMSWRDAQRLEMVCQQLQAVPLRVRLLPDRSMRTVLEQGAADSSSLLVEVQRAPLSRYELFAKRLLDLIVALGSIIILTPLFIVVAAAIALDSRGPVLFRQRRNGFGGRQFLIYKFRTMHVMEDGPEVIQARRHDPRVTRIGRLLRSTSIDELPQLFNVLKGDMSIVGPRPHALAHDDQYSRVIAEYAFRSHVKPGITGWAQVNGFRGETRHLEQMKKRIEMDVWYINNWSVVLDLQVMLRTVLEVARPRNAY